MNKRCASVRPFHVSNGGAPLWHETYKWGHDMKHVAILSFSEAPRQAFSSHAKSSPGAGLKGLALLLAFALLAASSFNAEAQNSITVFSPNGGEVWKIGSVHPITWQSVGDVGATVNIQLYQGGGLHGTIASDALNDGWHMWRIPSSLTPDTNYSIRVLSNDIVTLYDESDGLFQLQDADPPDRYCYVTNSERIIRIDHLNGDRETLSDYRTGSGPTFVDPQGIARETAAALIVADPGRNTLFRVDSSSGDRFVLSDNESSGSGALFVDPYAVAISSTGQIYVTEPGGKRVTQIDPGTGRRSTVSSWNIGSGYPLQEPTGIGIEANGSLVVADRAAKALLRIHPETGHREVMSGLGQGTGPEFVMPRGIAVEEDGGILVTDVSDSDPKSFVVYRVNPIPGAAFGNRTVLSDPSRSGPYPGVNLLDLAVKADGGILLTDPSERIAFGSASAYTVDPVTGDRTLLSGGAVGVGPALGLSGVVYGPRFVAADPLEIQHKLTVSVSVDAQSVVEADLEAIVTVELSSTWATTALVEYATEPGTATSPEDYTHTFGILQFDPGQQVKTISIPLADDGIVEPRETFTLRLVSAVNAQLGVSEQIVTILADGETVSGADSTWTGYR
jgi:sugar lactone lactonase YvrE